MAVARSHLSHGWGAGAWPAEIIPTEPVWVMPAKGAAIATKLHRIATTDASPSSAPASSAWRSAGGWRRPAARSTVFERGEAGHGASWAAAGMLAAGGRDRAGRRAAAARSTRDSQRLWPDFAARARSRLRASPSSYRDEGTLVVALNRDDAAQLRYSYDFQKGARARPRMADRRPRRGDASRICSPASPAAVFEPARSSGRQPPLGAALRSRACRAAGGRAARALPGRRDRRSPAGARRRRAGDGARSRPTSSCWRPARGRARSAASRRRAGRRCGRSRARCWRCNGPGGAAVAACAVAAARLSGAAARRPADRRRHRRGARLRRPRSPPAACSRCSKARGGRCRAIEELPIVETWVGFRPGSRDDAPMLGPSGVDRLVIATGHHRNGILLTPVTARAISRILTGDVDEAIRPFAPTVSPPPAREKA